MQSEPMSFKRTFGGIIVRSITTGPSGYTEFFQWFDPDRMEHTVWGIIGDAVLDERSFDDAMKLGPALIYERRLAHASPADVAEYFRGNTAVVFDTQHRADIAAANIEWPTDEAYVEGFYEMNSREKLAERYGTMDPDWEYAAATAVQWLVARAVVQRGSESLEILCWLTAHRADVDSDVMTQLDQFLLGHEMTITDGLVEFFQLHDLIPHSSTIMFEIGCKTRAAVLDHKLRALFLEDDDRIGEAPS
jgi:hypothetical protein